MPIHAFKLVPSLAINAGRITKQLFVVLESVDNQLHTQLISRHFYLNQPYTDLFKFTGVKRYEDLEKTSSRQLSALTRVMYNSIEDMA